MTSGVIDMKNKPSATKASGSRHLLSPWRSCQTTSTTLVHLSGFFTCLPKDMRVTTKDLSMPMRWKTETRAHNLLSDVKLKGLALEGRPLFSLVGM
jgi:hypothetical protein